MTEIFSPTVFKWMLTIVTGGLAGTWFIIDSITLFRARKLDTSDPVVRDKYFGCMMGIIIGAVGIIGCLRFHDVL